MTTFFNLLLLPLRAPLLLLLLLISVYLGLHWSRPGSAADSGLGSLTTLIWSAECLQALVVVVVCTVPELLLQRLSSLMAASRVASLVVTLLLVITGGLYLLHLDVLSNVLILASAVLLARLDLVRLRVVVPPVVMTLVLSVLVLGGISLGRVIEVQLRPFLPSLERHRPAAQRQALSGGAHSAHAPEPWAARAAADSPQAGADTPGRIRAESSVAGGSTRPVHRSASDAIQLAEPLPPGSDNLTEADGSTASEAEAGSEDEAGARLAEE